MDEKNGNPVEDPEIAKRKANEGTRAQTDLEQMQGYETQALHDAGRRLQQPQPALPEPDATGDDAGDDGADTGDGGNGRRGKGKKGDA